MRVAFYTFGCKVNQYETQVLSQRFAAAGMDVVPFGEEADAVVVNSCTVTAEGERKVRQLLRRIRREQPGAALVLTGCYPQAFPEAAGALDVDVITGSRDREGLLSALEDYLAARRRVVRIVPHTPGEAFEAMKTESFGPRTRAFVKIEDGCENHCTYCIIPTARGPVRSKPLADLKEELLVLAGAGYREVVLAGINLTAYGADLGLRFIDAVETAAGVPGPQRIRLGSMEPDVITREDIVRMRQTGKVCPQFHLSLQSGSDDTLRRMGRRYTAADYRRMAAALREEFPGAALTTDLMVGFPGETPEEFGASMAFAEEMAFAKIHVFAYSPRPGTRAAAMGGQVPGEEKRRRSGELLALGEALRRDFLTAMVGTTQQVLLEERGKHGQMGYTPNYTPVTLPAEEDRRGEIVEVLITSVDGDGCWGQLIIDN